MLIIYTLTTSSQPTNQVSYPVTVDAQDVTMSLVAVPPGTPVQAQTTSLESSVLLSLSGGHNALNAISTAASVID